MRRLVLALLLALAAWSPALAGDERTIALSNALDGAAQAEMHGEVDELPLVAMVPPMAPLRQVVLTIQYENGIDLLPERSRMLLAVNGEPVAELPLSAFRGPVTASITLPADRIRPGENRITLRQEAQHRAFCNVRGTFDLWSRVHLARSALVLRTDAPPPVPDLAMLPQLLAASDRAEIPLTILRVGAAMRPDHLGWGTLIAQGYALALGERAPRVASIALPAPQPGEAPAVALPGPAAPSPKAVLVGPRDELAGVLSPGILQTIGGPFLGVYPSGSAPGGFLIVVSGRTVDEVDQAALRFADIHRPLSTQASALVEASAVPVPSRPDTVLGPGRYRLAQLGVPTVTHTGYRYTGRLDVRLPADYKPVADRTIALRINAAFEGELGRGAVLNLRVNGRMAGAIEVDQRSSGDIRRAEMRLPMNLFRPGGNRIEFQAELPPAQETDCLYAIRKPRFTLFDNSEVEVPTFARLVTLPDLGTTARTGFPFLRSDGMRAEPFDLIVAGKDEAWYGVALTLVARLAQSAGEVLRAVPSVGWNAPAGRDALIVGPVGSLPQAALGGTQLAPDRLASLLEAGTRMSQALASGEPLPDAERRRIVERLRSVRTPARAPNALAGAAPGGMESSAARWERLAERTVPPPADQPMSLQGMLSRVLELVSWTGSAGVAVANSDLMPVIGGDDFLPDTALLQFAGPGGDRSTWTVLTGTDAAVAERATERLVTAALWADVEGGAALWRSGGGGVADLKPLVTYNILVNPRDLGNVFLIVASNLSQRIDVLFGLLLAAVLLLAVTMHLLLRLGRRAE